MPGSRAREIIHEGMRRAVGCSTHLTTNNRQSPASRFMPSLLGFARATTHGLGFNVLLPSILRLSLHHQRPAEGRYITRFISVGWSLMMGRRMSEGRVIET